MQIDTIPKPGSPSSSTLPQDLVALDDASEWSSFSEKNDGPQSHIWESRVAVEGMHCAACAFAVEKAIKSVAGVVSVEVNATSGRARIAWSEDRTRPSEWMKAVFNAGYQVYPRMETDSQRRKQNRLLLWRWLVSGFCMMQVMMYSYPVYVATSGDLAPDMLNLLRWASWVLTLPVIFFSSGPFFESALTDLRQKRISMDSPVALGILITFFVSTLSTFWPSGWWGKEVYFDSLTMFVFFLLTGRWLEARLRSKTAGSLDALISRLPRTIEKKDESGTFVRVSIRSLKPGDVVRVYNGEAFPADGRLIEGHTSADEALLTGESAPVNKDIGAEVIAGSHNVGATVIMQVDKVGSSTQYAQIVALMERVAIDKPRLAVIADKIAKPFLIGVIVAAVISGLFLWHSDPGKALMGAVAVLIVTCPCALSLATPVAMIASAGSLARQGILVQKLQAIEAIASVDTIVFDKTGTLTMDRIRLSDIKVSQHLNPDEALRLAASIAQSSLHPVSRAIVRAFKEGSLMPILDARDVPGEGLIAGIDGRTIRLGSAAHCGIAEDAVPGMHVFLADDRGFLAMFSLEEEVRADAEAAITKLKERGYEVQMLTGDRLSSARLVAEKIGITSLFADFKPGQKLAHIQELQKQGHKVAMVGDGLNDGPVLAGSDVSVAVGQAVPLAQAKSDFVVQSARLGSLPALIEQARKTMRIVKQNLVWAAVYNAICVPLAVLGYLPAWLAGLGMASSSLFVILNAARLARKQFD